MSLTRITPEDFVFNNDSISTSCWRDVDGNPVGDTETTPSFSTETFNDITNYYIGNPANSQFSITLADKNAADTAFSRKIYGAIRNIVVGDVNADIPLFTPTPIALTRFYVISINNRKLKSSLLPGSLRLGSFGAIFTDDSNMNPPRILNCGRAYALVLGTTLPGGGWSYGVGVSPGLGLFLPDVGLILVNTAGLFNPPPVNTFSLRNLDPTPSQHVFIRAQNNQYNYSMNPSFISGSSGKIIHQDWYNNPQTYITTVGLYNDNNELMATAKLPQPYNKNFQNELLLQVGLNF